MTSLTRSNGETGAMFDVFGTMSDFATWSEDIYFIENGAGVDLTGMSFQFQFRSDKDETGSIFSLSTDAGTLTLEEDDNSVTSIVRINAAAGELTTLVGDFVADLVAKDADDKVIHYAHGFVTFQNNPVAWT